MLIPLKSLSIEDDLRNVISLLLLLIAPKTKRNRATKPAIINKDSLNLY